MRKKTLQKLCIFLLSLLVALWICNYKCHNLFAINKKSDAINDVLLDVWFVKRNNQPQPFIADAAIPEQGLNAILKRRVDNGCKCTLQLRFSNDIDNNYALSMLESAFILGYTNIIIKSQQDLSKDLSKARIGEYDAPCYAY